MSLWTVFDRLAQDLRYGWRTLGRNRGFATVSILTLALGIGANTVIFSVWNAVDLRRLPVRDPQQLVMLEWSANAKWQGGSSSGYGGCDADRLHAAYSECSFSYPAFEHFRSRSKSVSGLAAVAGPAGLQARIRGEIVPASAQFVSGDFFQVLGVPAQLGRTIDESDDQAGAAPVAVLSFRYWESHFQSDPGVLGKTIALEGSPFTVVGIASKDFIGLNSSSAPDLWIAVHAQGRDGARRGGRRGRLAGVVGRHQADFHPSFRREPTGWIHLHGGHAGSSGGGAHGLLHSGKAGDADQPCGGIAIRVISARFPLPAGRAARSSKSARPQCSRRR
jgi:hypothetical protein